MQVRFLPGAQNMIKLFKIKRMHLLIDLIIDRLNFALASGTITILGIMMGLYSGTHMRSVIIGGIITVAIADAFSDALGFHISIDKEENKSKKIIWISTISSFLFKFLFILTFIIPAVFLELKSAIIVSIAWGLFIIGIVSYRVPLSKKTKRIYFMLEHFIIVIIVLLLTYYTGLLVSSKLGIF